MYTVMFHLNAKHKEEGWMKMNKFYGLNQKILGSSKVGVVGILWL